jgi:hypothetical protein
VSVRLRREHDPALPALGAYGAEDEPQIVPVDDVDHAAPLAVARHLHRIRGPHFDGPPDLC